MQLERRFKRRSYNIKDEAMDYLKDRAVSLPDKPGVYLMLDKTKQVIYVGKAKNLYNRVTSYFRSVENHDIKTRLMVSQVSDFDYIVTDTEFERLYREFAY